MHVCLHTAAAAIISPEPMPYYTGSTGVLVVAIMAVSFGAMMMIVAFAFKTPINQYQVSIIVK